MKNFGHVMWFRQRDGFGVVVDCHGTEFYFDKSVIPCNKKMCSGVLIEFDVNPAILDVRCISKITVLRSSSKISAIKELIEYKQKQLVFSI